MTEIRIIVEPFEISIGRIEVRALRLGLDMSGGGGGGAPAVTPSTWNPADKSAGITLSGGDLTAAYGGGGSSDGVRATQTRTGKRYFEALSVASGGLESIGLANLSAVMTANVGANANAGGYLANGNFGQPEGGYTGGTATWVASNVVQICYDPVAQRMWLGVNNVFGGDPVAGTGGHSTNQPGSTMGTTLVPFFQGTFGSSGTMTLRCLPASFSYTPPTGFAAWDT